MQKLSKSIAYKTSLDEKLTIDVNYVSLEVYFETWSNGYKQYETIHVINVTNTKLKEIFEKMNLHDVDVNVVMDFIYYG